MGKPDPEQTDAVIEAVNQAYGSGEADDERLAERRDRRTMRRARRTARSGGGRRGRMRPTCSAHTVVADRQEPAEAVASRVGVSPADRGAAVDGAQQSAAHRRLVVFRLEVDPVEALFALAIRSGRILHVRLPDGQVETLLDGAGSSPDGIVVESGVIYWTTMGAPVVASSQTGQEVRDWSAANGGVHAVGLDGTGKRDVVPVGAITTGKQLASDGAGTLYWSDREGCRVSRVRVDGSGYR